MKQPKLKPSLQQANFYDWIKNGKGSCVLEAVAGSGKTTTLIESLSLMSGRIFFGAYNKKIAEEIASRTGIRTGLEVSTIHAAGMRAWRRVAARFMKVEGEKCRAIFRAEVDRINPMDSLFEGPVLQLVSLAKQAAVGVISDPADRNVWMQLINHFNIETFDERSGIDSTDTIIEIAKHIFFISAERCKDIIDFDDMIFAPLYFNVAFDKYDWVLIDEAQDTNASRREMALRMLKEGGRLVAVGDRHQAIYGFTGADSDALDLIGAAVGAVQMPLTVSFRCPKAVVAYAQQWVSHIQAAETAPEGIVRYADIANLHAEVQVGDAILCRFNAPLIKHVYSLIAKGIPARVEGREIGTGLKQLANRWKVKTIDALLVKLTDYLEREVKKYEAKENNKAIEAVTDKVECLRVIINRVIAKGALTQPPQLAVIAEIDAIFGTGGTDDDKPVVLLSSIHKSKGREWHKVVWLQTGPSPFAKQDWEVVQENNLCYVAPTRAKFELVLINITMEKK
jgi:DNA helicase-2/ATP-dependent DNA helicase PcrA